MAKKQEVKEETKKPVRKQVLCKTCKFYIDKKCEHESNIKYFIHRRIETKGYKSLETKSECEFCQN